MAVYDGFFDAELAGENSDGTPQYDRAYSATDFTEYFAQIAGSGVSLLDGADACMVTFADGQASVAPGFLFIRGYWLRVKDEPYTIAVPGAEQKAIVAHLDTAQKRIGLAAQEPADSYPDALCLALVDPASGTVEDTRYDAEVCGVIETSGALYEKLAYAQNYIDNEIDAKLAAVEADVAAQEQAINAKLAAMQATVDAITPPSIGTIRFSASQDVGEEWLRCDGRFVNEQDYPELVAALGKLTPSADKFKLISDGEVGAQISNGVIYNGRMWVYSFSEKKLYGIDLEGKQPVKSISISSSNSRFSDFIIPSIINPIALSIVPHNSGDGARLFLAQFLKDGTIRRGNGEFEWMNYLLIFCADFSGNETSLQVSPPFKTVNNLRVGNISPERFYTISFDHITFVPYIVRIMDSGTEKYHCIVGKMQSPSNSGDNYHARIFWYDGQEEADSSGVLDIVSYPYFNNQRICYHKKNLYEAVNVYGNESASGGRYYYEVISTPSNTFSTGGSRSVKSLDTKGRESPCPINIASDKKALASFDINSFSWASITETAAKCVHPNLPLPGSARIFVDSSVYMWGKDIFMFFVGTGIIFSRTLEEGSFGYLDTTSVLGTITQYGYIDYSQDESTLYIVGQDTTNKVKCAKIVLNTLYDYANDGAWLPMMASDGVPAYIKAKEG